ncbi:MAG: PqqD family protein [Desulfobacterales bacterium]
MGIDFTKRAVVPTQVMFRELEGESVLLNIETETYFGLDDVGTRMWRQLTESPSIQLAYDALLSEYDVTPDTLKKDLGSLLEELFENGLIDFENVPRQK